METKDIYILGVGHNTIVYIDLVEACGFKATGLYHYNDERTGENIHGIPILDSNINLFKKDTLEGMNFAISVGDNKTRESLAEQIRHKGGNITTLIHPMAIVSRHAKIAKGVVVHANSIVQGNVSIGQDTVVSCNVAVGHTTDIGNACYLSFGSTVGAYVKIENNVFVGQASAIVSGKLENVGHNSIIGAGSVVIKNVEPYTVVAGNPAILIKRIQKK